MHISAKIGLWAIALSTALSAQEVIILDGGLPAPKAVRRDGQAQATPARGSLNAQILVQDDRSRSLRVAAPNDVFYDGQRFRLRVTSGTEGHLYALCLNSQGSANVIFPTADTDAMKSRIARRGAVTIPERDWFQFDSEPGVERVFLLVSQRPLDDLEQAIEQGGELSAAILQRYTTGRASQREGVGSKGIMYTGSDITVRKLELIHDAMD